VYDWFDGAIRPFEHPHVSMTAHTRGKTLQSLQKLTLVLAGILAILIIGYIDYSINPDVILALFYLIPIGLVAWFVGWRTGWLMGILSAVLAGYSTELQYEVLKAQPTYAIWSFVSRLIFFLLTAYILSRLRETLARSEELSLTDDLTRALNTRAFFDLLERELQRSRRYGHPLTVVYLDLDSFKTVNDTQGHQAGNTVLQTVVRVMRQAVREPDAVARLGGDEFAVLLLETGPDSARALLPRIQEALGHAMQDGGWPVTFSIGVLTCARAMCNSDEVFRRVDTLMYAVKHAGKNGIRFETLAE
jgi:diguanylate cyclase (GGDEF)-like protein